MEEDEDNEEPQLPDWTTGHTEPFDVATIELMREMGLDGAAEFNVNCHLGMGGMGPSAVAGEEDWNTDLERTNIRHKTAELVRMYVRTYHEGLPEEDNPIHEVLDRARLVEEKKKEPSIRDREMSETPRLLFVDGSDRVMVGLEWSPGSLRIYQSSDEEELRPDMFLYNSWDAELYKVTRLGDDVALLEVLNAQESMEVDREWAEIDRGRIIPMEEV